MLHQIIIVRQLSGFEVGVKSLFPQTHECHHDAAQAAIESSCREGSDRQSFHMFVESLVVVLKTFVVRQVARSRPIEYRTNEARAYVRPPNAACSLNVFRRVLWLASDHHEPEAIDVPPNRNLVGC